MALVRLPRSLVDLFPALPRQVDVPDVGTVAELIASLDARWPGLRDRLCDEGPALREHINVFVDGERAGLSAPLRLGSVVIVLPAVAGG